MANGSIHFLLTLRQAHPILVAGDILPSLRSPAVSSSQTGYEKIQTRPKEHGPKKSAAVAPRSEPAVRRLRTARAKATKAGLALEHMEKSYVQSLANFLVTYGEFSKEDFDGLYQRTHNGKSHAMLSAEGGERVRQAEVECEDAWRAAVAAGITDLPPSPKDLGDRSEDGRASSCNSENQRLDKQSYERQKPGIDRWQKTVARSGSPVDPEKAPQGTSVEQDERAYPDLDRDSLRGMEITTSKARVERYRRHQERMRKRARDQEAERLKEQPRAKKRCIIL